MTEGTGGLFAEIALKIRDKATRGKGGYPDEQLLAVSESITEVIAESCASASSSPALADDEDALVLLAVHHAQAWSKDPHGSVCECGAPWTFGHLAREITAAGFSRPRVQ